MKIEAKTNETKNICNIIRGLKSLLATKSRAPHLTGTQKRHQQEKERLSVLRRNKYNKKNKSSLIDKKVTTDARKTMEE